MYGVDGPMIGEVSVGLRESSVSAALWNELPAYAGWFAIALSAGAVASWLLARRLKRRTFGLELGIETVIGCFRSEKRRCTESVKASSRWTSWTAFLWLMMKLAACSVSALCTVEPDSMISSRPGDYEMC